MKNLKILMTIAIIVTAGNVYGSSLGIIHLEPPSDNVKNAMGIRVNPYITQDSLPINIKASAGVSLRCKGAIVPHDLPIIPEPIISLLPASPPESHQGAPSAAEDSH